MSANIAQDGTVRQLDRPAEPDENIVEKDVTDTERLVRLLMRIMRELTDLRRRWWPRRIDFEDVAVDDTNTTKYRLQHNFNGRARWWVVDWQSSAGGGFWLDRHSDSDETTLVVTSGVVGVVTIRVEEAGA